MKILLLYLIFIPYLCVGQKEDYQWLLGGGTGLSAAFQSTLVDFNTAPVEITQVVSNIDFTFGLSSICDENGTLHIISNGTDLFNGDFQKIENGTDYYFSEYGYSREQSTLLLEWPGHDNIYIYFFGDDEYDWNNGNSFQYYNNFHYSVVDMSLNNGAGKVTERKKTLTNDTLFTTAYTACRHANGRDWWILAANIRSRQYHAFLLDPSGIHLHHKQKIASAGPEGGLSANYSPDGLWYATFVQSAHDINNTAYSAIDFYQFDRCTGLLSNHKRKNYDTDTPGSVFFSPNSRYMYAINRTKIFQYDLTAQDIIASEILVAEYDGFVDEVGFNTRFYQGMLAPDDKIYICTSGGNSRWMHTIEHPNEAGIACNVVQHAIQLPTHNNFIVPNIPYHRLGPVDNSACDTLGLSPVNAMESQQPACLISPNPANTVIHLQFNTPTKAETYLTIFNPLGQIIQHIHLESNATEYFANVDQFPAGIYYYKVSENYTILKQGKLIIEH